MPTGASLPECASRVEAKNANTPRVAAWFADGERCNRWGSSVSGAGSVYFPPVSAASTWGLMTR